MLVGPFLALVLRMDDRLNLVPHQVEPRVFGDLDKMAGTNMQMNPTRLQMKESVEKT